MDDPDMPFEYVTTFICLTVNSPPQVEYELLQNYLKIFLKKSQRISRKILYLLPKSRFFGRVRSYIVGQNLMS